MKNLEKRRFLIINDYGHGGTGWIVLARTKEEVEAIFKSGNNTIFDNDADIDEHPFVRYMKNKIQIYDIDKPTGILKYYMMGKFRKKLYHWWQFFRYVGNYRFLLGDIFFRK